MNSCFQIRSCRRRVVRLAAVSLLCSSTLFASGLTSGHYHFQVRYAPVCLYGNYPMTVRDMTTQCFLSVNTDATGALTGTLNIRTVPGAATGTFTSQNDVVSLHLHAIG